MKAVGVKQLKARLSEYLRLVKTGETVLITDRDEVVAELRPARRQRSAALSVDERLQALAWPRASGRGRSRVSACRRARPTGSSTRSVATGSEGRGHLLYVDTSAVLRSTLEAGTSPSIEERIRDARVLIASRLALVESCRALIRLQAVDGISAARVADAERDIGAIWSRCELWEVTREVCETACAVARTRPLRALDALHLATFVLARRHFAGLELLTTDDRLHAAATGLTD
jgi:antitoxin (DNA-binding transcriptional repressor) of toxin-antitoxin stability system/predicted nucleic acid-binding protein